MLEAVRTALHFRPDLGYDLTVMSILGKRGGAFGTLSALTKGYTANSTLYIHPAETGHGFREIKNISLFKSKGSAAEVHAREELVGIVNLLKQGTCDAGAETDHTSCGQVAAGGDNASCDTESDNQTVAHVGQDVQQVVGGQEVVGCQSGVESAIFLFLLFSISVFSP